jgi:hypothetical protein
MALVFHLNESGATWSKPERPDGHEIGVDFISRGSGGTLAIQVTRVPRDQAQWQSLRRDGHVANAVDIAEAALDLINAIRHKGRKSRPKGNADVTLVLDASTSLVYTLSNTLEEFVREYHEEAKTFGFASIWLVGGMHLVCLSEATDEHEGSRLREPRSIEK